MAVPNKFKEVKKRDGRIVPFDQNRITEAIRKAMQASGEGDPERDAVRVSDRVVTELNKRYPADHTPTIEEIQDVVEESLILMDFPKVAKAYILYRQKRAEVRAKSAMIPERVKQLAAESKKYFRNPLAEFIYYRSYSRWIEEEGRRETWTETVERYINFMKENLGERLSEDEYNEIRLAILHQEVMPSMRLLWSAGKAARATNVAAYNCLAGKTPILTKEYGIIPIEEAYKFGTVTVLSHDGRWHKAIINSFGVQYVFDITFSKGRRVKTISATKDHRWFINGSFKTTAELSASAKKLAGDKIIPVLAPKVIDDQKQYKRGIIHGLVYGDGTTTYKNGKKSGHLIRLCKDNIELLSFFDGYKYSRPPSYKGDIVVYLYDQWAKATDLKELPNTDNPSYILGFIRGWFAADGSITKQGQAILAANEKGAKWLKRWAEVVGLSTGHVNQFTNETNYGIRSQPLYRVYFFEGALGKEDLLLKKHKKHFKSRNSNLRYGGWNVKNVSKNPRKEIVYCATVPGIETFVLEEGLITGNCSFIAPRRLEDFAEIMYLLMCGTGVGFSVENQTVQELPIVKRQVGKTLPVHVIEDSKEGWGSAFLLGLKTWYSGFDIAFDYSKLRPAGARLKTMGGRSSGPGPLRALLDFSRSKILSRQGRRLSSLDVHDIICKIGEIVVAGGVRRSALISLSDLDDDDMRFAKSGPFYFTDPQRQMANNSAVYNSKPSATQFLEEWLALAKSGTGERGIFNRGSLKQQLPERRWKAFEKYWQTCGTNPCGEIILRSKEFCNLTEVVCRPEDTEESLLKKIRIATILGTYQSMLTNFPYLSKEWKENCEEERLLGVSLTGQWDSPQVRNPETLRKLKEHAIEINQIYAKRFGINPSLAISCIKPSGTVSQLVDSASGMHPRHSRYYIRRVRISATDPLFHMLRDQKFPHHPEVGQLESSATTFVLEFPVAAPKGAIVRNDLSAFDQLEHWKMVKQNFTEHNPSVTVSVGADEWLGVANWLYENWDILGGLSFLPREEHVYQLAPYEEITEEEYNRLVKNLPPVDFSAIVAYEKEDFTTGSKELACVGNVCEIDIAETPVSS